MQICFFNCKKLILIIYFYVFYFFKPLHRSKAKLKSSIENGTLKSVKLFAGAKDLKRFTNLNSIEDEDSQIISKGNLNVEVTNTPNSRTTSSTISQKSMSATNLFDVIYFYAYFFIF